MKLVECTKLGVFWHDSKKITQKGESLGYRIVQSYELDFIVSNINGSIWTNGARIETKPGTLFVRKPGDEVEGITHYSSWYVQFDAVIDEFCFPEYMAAGKGGIIEDYFKKLFDWYQAVDSDREYYLQFYMNAILFEVYKNHTRSSMGEGTDSIGDVKKYIYENWNKNISLEELTVISGYSKSRFSHRFKEQYGMSPMKYLTHVRMNQVCRWLVETDMLVKEIQLLCGQKNEQMFFREFKECYGMSPSEYRKRYKVF